MASSCPQCHTEVEEDIICCAALRHSWKCRKCGKRSTGFVVPYGRCYLCGGENEVVAPFESPDPKMTKVIEEAVQFEVDMFHFYRLALDRTPDPSVQAVLRDLYAKEQDHLAELEKKYHVHLDPLVLEPMPDAEDLIANTIFEGIPFEDLVAHVPALYERALTMERRTRDHFQRRAGELPDGPEREICRELAAEEEDHVTMLETELQQYTGDVRD